ncbi:MAG: hypothetical protein A2138_21255 [Deltaproteobacteria bacterium RBG_16_71_12]|nr:MAG: hypothetical protein A2138_21255 [Deltaproteobacteria bacterium RBG_16_71_12]
MSVLAVRARVVRGPQSGCTLQLSGSRVRIGSAATCDVRIDDPTVSRVHCVLHLDGEVPRVVDMDSTNGTVVNGVRVRDADLPTGALLTLGASALAIEVSPQRADVAISSRTSFGGLLGTSLAMRRVYALLERVAPTEASVLLEGETGTGKEVAARAMHDASPRRDRSFVAIDCGAIAASLIESELFGHVRGAFSGAVSERRGLFEEAAGGTVFLDEIGELPLSSQPKLLRALEMRIVRRVGANTETPIDVRVIAATHRPLARAVNDGAFREDLYYRLAVVEIELPPLRSRREDVAVLAQHFHRQAAGGADAPPALLEQLASRPWLGNVRELRNHVQRAVAVGWDEDGGARSASTMATVDVATQLPLAEARERATAAFEEAYARALLERAGGSVSRAAELAGVNRRTFQRLLRRAHGDGEE